MKDPQYHDLEFRKKQNVKQFNEFIDKQGVSPKTNRGKALRELWEKAGSPYIEDHSIGGVLPRPFNLLQQFAQGFLRNTGMHWRGNYVESGNINTPDMINASSLGILENELMHGLQFQEAYKEGEEGFRKLDKAFDTEHAAEGHQWGTKRYGERGRPFSEVSSLPQMVGWTLENILQGISEGVDYGMDINEKIADIYPYEAWFTPVDESGFKSNKMQKYEEGVTDPSELPKEFEAHRVMLPREKKKLRAREKSLKLEDQAIEKEKVVKFNKYLKSIDYKKPKKVRRTAEDKIINGFHKQDYKYKMGQ